MMEVIDWKISPNKLKNPFKSSVENFNLDKCVSGGEEWRLTSLLHMACSNGDLTLLQQVLDDTIHDTIDMNCVEPHDGATPLHRLSLLVGNDRTAKGNLPLALHCRYSSSC